MKKFYKSADAAEQGGGFTVQLDGRAIKTPAKTAFIVPGRALADAIAQEWQDQDEELDIASMSLTGLSYAAIDRVRIHREDIAQDIAAYAANDLLCYRADNPQELVARQSDAWDPILDWARDTLDIDLVTVAGIISAEQSPEAPAKARAQVDACDDFMLAGLDRLTHITGSLILALAVRHGRIDATEAYELGHLEERWQAELWGTDAEAEQRHETRIRELVSAERFVRLLAD